MSYVTLDASSGEVEATVTTDNEEIIELKATITELEGEAKEAFYDARDARIKITELTSVINRLGDERDFFPEDCLAYDWSDTDELEARIAYAKAALKEKT